jgi:two-component system, LytTR family, sensor kinase
MKLAPIMGFWTLFGLLYASQHYIGFGPSEKGISWWQLAGWQLLIYYTWGLVTPLILWLGQRFPIERSRLARPFLVHIPAGAILSLIHIAAYTGITEALGIYPDWHIKGFTNQFVHYIWMYFHLDFFTYFAILGVGYAFDYYHKYRERELQASELRTRLAEAQLQALKMQLHPHFLFNTLNTVTGLVRNNENRAAVSMIAGLSDLLRYVLENSNRQEVPLTEELEFARRYLEIQQIRFQDRLDLRIEAEPCTLQARVPNLILQPLVENAIQHGIAARASSGLVALAASRNNGQLLIEISNDGPPLPEDWRMEASTGIGLANTRARLDQLYGANCKFDVNNRAEGGVVATLVIPFRNGRPVATADEQS